MKKGRRVNLLSISGGKDSTAMLLLAIERGIDFQCVFADTGHEHSETYDYLDYLESNLPIKIQRVKPDFSKRILGKAEYIKAHWSKDGVSDEKIQQALEVLKPTGNPFLDLCIWKGRFPSTKARFCTDELKTVPITEQVVFPILREGKKIRSWQGIRADESPRRRNMPMHEPIDHGIWVYRPLLRWNSSEVFDIHRKHGIKPNPLYLKGMGRVGCMPCIMCRKGELAQISIRFPEVIERLKKWEAIVSDASKQGVSTFFATASITGSPDGDIYLSTHGIESAAKWARTERGGRQYDLFLQDQEVPTCSSNYGLCEIEDDS